MKNLLFLFSLILMIGFSSCSKSNELDVSSDDVQLLRSYVDEANALINVVGEIDGNVSAIFNIGAVNNNSCEGSVLIIDSSVDHEASLLLDDMIDKMGFESTIDLHNWMVEAGKVMYDIREVNKKNFDTDREIMNALACEVIPAITTRNGSSVCYKDNLVTLFLGTLSAGSMYGNKKDLSESECSSRGSSFNKIWLFMENSYDCE